MLTPYIIVLSIYIISIFIGLLLNITSKNKLIHNSNKKKKPYVHNYHILHNKWKKGTLFIYVLVLILLILYHAFSINDRADWAIPYICISFLYNTFMTVSSYFNPTYIRPQKDIELNLKTTIVIPVYNEDLEMFKKALQSLRIQTRLADVICVIEDGSLEENKCQHIFESWAIDYPGETYYEYIPNSGKREAQAIAFRKYMDETDIFITIDSDTILEKRAVEEGLYPFYDETIMSVGGVLLDYNNKDNLLTRIVGISFVSTFANGRAAYSRWKSVIVNCGSLAFYRKEVIEKNLEHFLNQMVFGQKARHGDDRMLTQCAAIMGNTVCQETSFGYTLIPVKLSHLIRQRTRWGRSFWFGGFWFLRNQSPRKFSWWFQMYQYASFFVYIPIFFFSLIYFPVREMSLPWAFLFNTIRISYMRNFKSLTIEREDMSKLVQVLSYLIFTPLSMLLNIFLGSILRIWSLMNIYKASSWGTRKNVEVGISKEGGSMTVPAGGLERVPEYSGTSVDYSAS
ncbi:MAG: glycosyltransferase [Lachnospiraceae bacterium]